MGALILLAGTGVRFILANLLYFLPDLTPHQSVAYARVFVVRLMTYSPFFLIIAQEWREGLRDI
jgi:hypothetical protein